MRPERGKVIVRLFQMLGAGIVAVLLAAPATPQSAPRRYSCFRTDQPPRIDGRTDDGVWDRAPWSEAFVDIEDGDAVAPEHRTRVRMLWDADYLYVSASLREPHLWATLRERDSVIWQDDDFEIFLDPDGDRRNYFEIEINALGTIFDLLLERTYREGGPADHAWTAVGLVSAVSLDGTLNDPSDRDRGWELELAIPWAALGERAAVSLPPRPGDAWRMNFSRVDWPLEIDDGAYRKVAGRRERNWVWSPQGVIDMHRPERWGYVEFVERPPGGWSPDLERKRKSSGR